MGCGSGGKGVGEHTVEGKRERRREGAEREQGERLHDCGWDIDNEY